MSNQIFDEIVTKLPDFIFEKRISQGTYGDVWLIKEVSTEQYYILKILHSAKNKNNIYFAQREIKVLKYIEDKCNPYLICIKAFKEYPEFTLILLDYIPNSMDLYDFLNEYFIIMNIVDKLYIMYILSIGLEQLHKIGVVHRDIKTKNILIIKSNNIQVRYIDFGFACEKIDLRCLSGYVGTPYYASQRLLQYNIIDKVQGKNLYSTFEQVKEDDIWALGITFMFIFFNLSLWPPNKDYTTPLDIKNRFNKIARAKNFITNNIYGTVQEQIIELENVILPMIKCIGEPMTTSAENIRNKLEILYNKYKQLNPAVFKLY